MHDISHPTTRVINTQFTPPHENVTLYIQSQMSQKSCSVCFYPKPPPPPVPGSFTYTQDPQYYYWIFFQNIFWTRSMYRFFDKKLSQTKYSVGWLILQKKKVTTLQVCGWVFKSDLKIQPQVWGWFTKSNFQLKFEGFRAKNAKIVNFWIKSCSW